MAAPALEGIDWREVRAVAETGMGLPEVAAKFGIPHKLQALYKRAQREGWLTIERVNRLHAERKAKRQDGKPLSSPLSTEPGAMSTNVHKAPKALEIAAESPETLKNHVTERARRILDKIWEKVENAPPSVDSISDLEKVDKMTRLNEGMTTGEAVASVQLLFSSGQDASVPREIEAREVEEGEIVGELE